MARESGETYVTQIARLKKDKRFRVYPTERQLSSDQSMDWSGTLGDFLDWAVEAGVKTLYLSEWTQDTEHPGREPEGDLEVGFLLDGIMHVYSTVEPSKVGESEAIGPALETLVKEHRTELIKAAADEILKRPETGYGITGSAHSLVSRFITEKLGIEESAIGGMHHLGSVDVSPEGQIILGLVEEIVVEVKAREKPAIQALYPGWLAFARQIGGHALSQGDLDVFLDGQNAKLTRDSRQELWTRAKADLRAERTAEKLERGKSKR